MIDLPVIDLPAVGRPRLDAVAELTREAARQAARRELSKARYRDAEPSLLERGISAVLRRLGELLDRVTVPGGRGGLLLLALLVVGAVAVVLVRLGPLQRRTARGPAPALDAGPRQSAEGHRQAALQAEQAGAYAAAVREWLRAVVRELEDRGVLDVRPGRTALEVARDGGAALPALAGELSTAAVIFDQVWYGGRPASPADAARLAALAERVRQERPQPVAP